MSLRGRYVWHYSLLSAGHEKSPMSFQNSPKLLEVVSKFGRKKQPQIAKYRKRGNIRTSTGDLAFFSINTFSLSNFSSGAMKPSKPKWHFGLKHNVNTEKSDKNEVFHFTYEKVKSQFRRNRYYLAFFHICMERKLWTLQRNILWSFAAGFPDSKCPDHTVGDSLVKAALEKTVSYYT